MINIRTLEAFLAREPIFVGAFIDGVRVDSITVLREDEIPAAIEALQEFYPEYDVKVYRRLSDNDAPQGDTQ